MQQPGGNFFAANPVREHSLGAAQQNPKPNAASAPKPPQQISQ
jgi:hypothetical protein